MLPKLRGPSREKKRKKEKGEKAQRERGREREEGETVTQAGESGYRWMMGNIKPPLE